MKINFYTETELINMDSTGLVTAYKELREALEKRGIDTVVNAKNDYDLIHIHSFGFLSLYRVLKDEKPVAITTHTVPDEMSLLYRGGWIIESLVKRYLRFFYNQADLLISPSEFARERVKEIGVEKDPVVISNGIDPEKYSYSQEKEEKFREKHGYSEDETIIGCVGLTSKRKGLEKFAETAEKLPGKKFVWVGKNEYGRLLKDYRYLKKLERDRPENMEMTGFVEDIQAAYSAFDIFLFPTKIETEGLVVLEAASADLPVITSNIEGLNWLEDGENCLKGSDPEEYAEKINELEGEPELREKMIEGGKKVLERKKFSNVAEKITGKYREVIEEG